MKIVAARFFRQQQTFVAGEYRCRNHTETGFDSTIVELETDSGLHGWGEMAPLGSFYSAAFAEGARAGLPILLPCLIGEDPRDIQRIGERMDDQLNGHPYIKCPVDMACWDLLGKANEQSLAELLGGRLTESTPLYRSISQAAPEVMSNAARELVASGYSRLQVKVGDDPREDAERLRAVLAAVGKDVLLLADANGAWQTEDAMRFIHATSDLAYYLEQPCMTLDECADLRPHCVQPMILDESIETMRDIKEAIGFGINGVTIKLSRVGGISKARQIRDLAVAQGLKVCIEDTGGSDIDTAATTHMMVSMPVDSQMHTVDFMNWVHESNASGMPPTEGGRIYAPTGPGLGLEIDTAALGAPLAEFG